MPYLHDYRLFISHAWSYSDDYQRLSRMLNEATNFQWRNYSVPEAKGFNGLSTIQLKDQIRLQIGNSQCVVILGGMYAKHSGWIQFEINTATQLNKPILAVMPWAGERMPVAVQNAATKIVNWNSSSIIDGIRQITP